MLDVARPVASRLTAAAPVPERSAGVRRVVIALVAGSALLFVSLGLHQAARDAPTTDEAVYLVAGASSLVHRDLRMNPEHPPLVKALAAAPALTVGIPLPTYETWRSGDWFDYTDERVSELVELDRLRSATFRARLVPLAIGVAVGGLVLWAGRLTRAAGVGELGAVLWFLSPLAVGYSHVLTVDVPFAAATLLTGICLVRWWDEPTDRNAAVLAAATSLTLLTRHLGLVAVAAVLVAVLLRSVAPRARLRAAGIVAVGTMSIVWLVYRLIAPGTPGGLAGDRLNVLADPAAADSLAVSAALLLPLPLEFRAGLGYLDATSDLRPAYLFGQAWEGSQWWFFPGSILAKVPWLVLALAAVGIIVASVGRGRVARVLGLAAVPGLAATVGVLAQPLNLGVRYVLPLVVVLMLLGGASLLALRASLRPAVIATASAWLLVVAVAAHPHSLAHTVWPLGPGYQVVSDSNLDWNQDWYRLEEWARSVDRPFVSVVTPRGLGRPEGTRALPDDPSQVTGWVAVGATSLTVINRDDLSWLRRHCPVGEIGGSILLYRFAEPPAADPGPDRPAAPCAATAEFSTARP